MRKPIILLTYIAIFSLSIGAHSAVRSQQAVSTSPEQEFQDAIKKGRTARVAELLKQYPAVINSSTKNGTTPVLLAIYAQHPEIAEALLATGIKPNIFEAAATGRVGRVKELINTSPALVKAHSPDGWTALHLNFGNLEIVKVLLDSGSDINAVSKNAFSASPLQGAAAFHKIELARLLIARGANVNCCAAEGGTPLHETAGSGQVEFAKLLLEHGANINAKDEHGKTPLAVALAYKQDQMAKFLRAQKAVQ
ncbi:MAG TPA: ankyrin repeat domain-containing protein [Pyrinomonadaceae bacterium]|nr:ankyrin repeat domain-containing protein [Pyrinomonadaceae bacterium]